MQEPTAPVKAKPKTLLQRPKGTQDILPDAMAQWQWVEATARRFFQQAHCQEIRTPIFEATELFERGVGEATDIVNKEMYTFEKGERRLTLRPENTAGVVRAYIENGMSRWPKPVKLFYIGPMFRYERPQAGRQRQFHQLGLECFGIDSPAADAEVISLAMRFFQTLGLPELALEINNLGCPACREAFKSAFRQQIEPSLPELCGSCQERYHTNPLRMLDCKVESCQALYRQPAIGALLEDDFTCGACQQHFSSLRALLDALEIPYRRNARLVRGLDYYTKTVFEITSTHLGAQNAVCGGGRYNHLVEELGGPDTPAIGWALGMERLVSLLPTRQAPRLDYFVVCEQAAVALAWATQLRQAGHSVDWDLSGKGFGKQLAQAGKLQAQHAVILGGDELENATVTLKNLVTGEQHTESQAAFLKNLDSGKQ